MTLGAKDLLGRIMAGAMHVTGIHANSQAMVIHGAKNWEHLLHTVAKAVGRTHAFEVDSYASAFGMRA